MAFSIATQGINVFPNLEHGFLYISYAGHVNFKIQKKLRPNN